MKNLKQLGLTELTQKEMIEINGGSQLLSDIVYVSGQAARAVMDALPGIAFRLQMGARLAMR